MEIIKVEDTAESFKNAMEELYKSLLTGSKVGFDLSELSREKQIEMIISLDKYRKELLEQ